MNRRFTGTLALGVIVALFSGTTLAIGPTADLVQFRYPGVQIMRSEQVDTSHLSRGWLTWHATYQTAAAVDVVALWYAQRLPGSDTQVVGQCQTLHQSQSLWLMLRSVTVQLCARRPGTAILVHEDVYVAH